MSSSSGLEVVVGCKVVFKYGKSRRVVIVTGKQIGRAHV